MPKLRQFRQSEIKWLEESIFIKQTKKGDTPYIKCLVRNKDIQLKPEEAIRQLYLKILINRYQYPVNRLAVEYGVNFGREVKRADIVVLDKDRVDTAYIIIEVKKPNGKWQNKLGRDILIQKSIRDKVEESHYKREQSKQLLEIAKTGVEKAIEENEEQATDWINQQLNKLGVEL